MKKHFKTFILLLGVVIVTGITGCSGGGVNGEGTSSSADINAPVVRGNVTNDAGWNYVNKGQYESAIKYFNDVLADSPTVEERAEANNGIGWAKAKNGKMKDGMKWFQLAADYSDDAKVGLAAAYLQQASLSDLEEVIDILYVQLGHKSDSFAYIPRRNTGVTNADVHAMLAYAFAATGDSENAEKQLNIAKELQPNYTGTTLAQIISAIEFLNN